MTDAERKGAWLGMPHHDYAKVVRFAGGSSYKGHLRDLIERAAGLVGDDGVATFRLYYRWEAEYVREQMEQCHPEILYCITWIFGGTSGLGEGGA